MTKEMKKKLIQKLLLKRINSTVKKTDSVGYYHTFQHSSTGEVEKSKHLKGDYYVKSVLGGMSDDDLYSPYDPDQITVSSNHWD
jgi:hypothetical protein